MFIECGVSNASLFAENNSLFLPFFVAVLEYQPLKTKLNIYFVSPLKGIILKPPVKQNSMEQTICLGIAFLSKGHQEVFAKYPLGYSEY